MSPFVFVTFVFVLVPTFFTLQRKRSRMLNECAQCRYDLSGHDLGAACPECACTTRAFSVEPGSLVPRRDANTWLVAATLAALILLSFTAQTIATHLLISAYILDGFTESAARKSIPIRELREGHEAALMLLWPIVLVLVFAPLLAISRQRAAAWKLWITLLLCSTLLSITLTTEVLRHF